MFLRKVAGSHPLLAAGASLAMERCRAAACVAAVTASTELSSACYQRGGRGGGGGFSRGGGGGFSRGGGGGRDQFSDDFMPPQGMGRGGGVGASRGGGGGGDREAFLRHQQQMMQQERAMPPQQQQRFQQPPPQQQRFQQQQMMMMEDEDFMQQDPRGAPPPQQRQFSQQQQAPEPEPEPEPPKKPEGVPKALVIEGPNEKGVYIVKLNRAPVNLLDLDTFDELNAWLLWLSYTDDCKGIILTSALAKVFSGGLDLNELVEPKEERFGRFWSSFQETWTLLNSYPKPIVAAINGNSPAAGCILAISCDSRIMARSPAGAPDKQYRIGLNETKIGLIAPPWVMTTLTYVIGSRKAERHLQLGETPTADEALAIGLVDQVVEEDKVMEAASKELDRYLAIPATARWMTRDMMRREVVQFMSTDEERQYDVQFFTNMVRNEEAQANLQKYMQRLKERK